MNAHPGSASARPLDAGALRRALVEGQVDGPVHGPADGRAQGEGQPPGYTSLDVLDEVGSTNAELLRRAREEGAPDRSVLLAEFQAAGRGRLGRAWTAPPHSQVAVSVLLRPGDVTPSLFGWLPLVTGLAVRDGLRAAGAVDATLKWPNDVLVDGRKIAGILVEMTTVDSGGGFDVRLPALVVGVGVNVTLTEDELPVPHATSLALAGGSTDRDALAIGLLGALARRHRQWRDCERGSGSTVSDELLREYSDACSTLGADVRVELPGGVVRTGRVARIDRDGRLVVVDHTDTDAATGGEEFAVAAGDVTHLRAADGGLGG